jgi:hypothetical protein
MSSSTLSLTLDQRRAAVVVIEALRAATAEEPPFRAGDPRLDDWTAVDPLIASAKLERGGVRLTPAEIAGSLAAYRAAPAAERRLACLRAAGSLSRAERLDHDLAQLMTALEHAQHDGVRLDAR